MARWRMPPDSSCGYWRSRRSGDGIATLSSRSRARARAAARETPSWRTIASAIWSPTVKTGSSAVAGSWNTIAATGPRSRRRLGGREAREVVPVDHDRAADAGTLRMQAEQRRAASPIFRNRSLRSQSTPRARARSKPTPSTARSTAHRRPRMPPRDRAHGARAGRSCTGARLCPEPGACIRHATAWSDAETGVIAGSTAGANIFGLRAARAEPAARGRVDRARRVAAQRRERSVLHGVDRGSGAMPAAPAYTDGGGRRTPTSTPPVSTMRPRYSTRMRSLR